MRPSMLLLTIVMVISTVVFGCDEKVYGADSVRPMPYHAPEVAPVATTIEAPRAPAIQPAAVVDGLATRMQEATEDAAKVGANISVAVLDRISHQLVTNGNTRPIATASVAKLFIADDLLLRQPETGLSADDKAALDSMLRSSDDGAAETFWNQNGRNAIITRVASRYGLANTSPPSNGAWWNTISTTPDLARYYDMLLNGAGGLPPAQAAMIMNNLALSTPNGLDGYPQRFGLPEGLYDEPVAVKQGWMCCIGNNWMHLSTGVVGADRRYIVVIESLQPSDDATARDTITEAVKTIFPGGRI
ncbi:beta-lactamase family protein [Mycolicibacter arupensis]|uniref:Lipoprotein LppW n=2 Tax=Mycolicibacter arupensis TaxID=342002 RepID=A0A5B1MFI6_9MYCO|nr:beta-lactamase family protein [Mycolicibacter arupensis]MCV7277462.1 hypothetical protein [Mycolicibacter arupensis]TXI52146.1 MAG: hypothetical protein E6Q54_18990 [Mycolicibacter arupensis]